MKPDDTLQKYGIEKRSITSGNVAENIFKIFYSDSSQSENDILVDMQDIESILQYKGIALLGISEFLGLDAVRNTLINIVSSLKRNAVLISDAKGAIIQFKLHPMHPVMEICEGLDVIHEEINDETELIFCTQTDKSLPLDYVRTTFFIASMRSANSDADIEIPNVYFLKL